MGVLKVGTRRMPRDSGELCRLVDELVDAGVIEPPDEPPHYVKNPDDPRMPAGWWWTPAHNGGRPVFLGTNVFRALAALTR